MQLPPYVPITVHWLACCEHGLVNRYESREAAEATIDRRNGEGGREECKPWGLVKETTQVAYEVVDRDMGEGLQRTEHQR